MSQINGLKYLITREGEDGKLGKIQGALQVVENSILVEELTKGRWYEGSKEEWEAYSKAVAGDVDGDGDFDNADQEKIEELNKEAE